MRSTAGASGTFELPTIARQLTVAVWSAALVLFLLVATWLLVRRTSGSLVWPLPAVVLLATAGALTIGMSALARWADSQRSWPLALSVIATVIALAAVTLPGTNAWAVGTVWFTLAGTACGLVATRVRPPRASPIAPTDLAVSIDEADETISDALVQQLIRHHTESGGESIHVIVRTACEPGDARVVVHLAFCPPLAGTPKLAAYPIDDSGAEAAITVVESYGARIELRLPRPAAAGDQVLLEVVGQAAGDSVHRR